jgi:hypothetical protein
MWRACSTQLHPGTRAPRRTSVILRADFIELAHESVVTNTEHGGIVLVPLSLREDEFQAIADAIDVPEVPRPLVQIVDVFTEREQCLRYEGSRTCPIFACFRSACFNRVGKSA